MRIYRRWENDYSNSAECVGHYKVIDIYQAPTMCLVLCQTMEIIFLVYTGFMRKLARATIITINTIQQHLRLLAMQLTILTSEFKWDSFIL